MSTSTVGPVGPVGPVGADGLATAWCNVLPRLSEPLAPALDPGTRVPAGPDVLAGLFPPAVAEQEVSSTPWIDVPGGVLDVLRLWRPTPLVRARGLERALDTPARIYLKDESVSPVGSHQANTAVAQAFYSHAAGASRLVTEPGAGQWAAALAFACRRFGLGCDVFTGRSPSDQDPARRILAETWGVTWVTTPEAEPEHPGPPGPAVSAAVRAAVARPDAHYALGSVLNHVLLHQTVIGLEVHDQLRRSGEATPDVLVGAGGDGSELGGLFLPFLDDPGVRMVAAEPSAQATLTGGEFGYDVGDPAGLTPLLPMYSLGHADVLHGHGTSPVISALVRAGRIEAISYPRGKVFEAMALVADVEGRIAAPQTGHALRATIDEALAAREEGRPCVIVCCYAGHGLYDLAAYDAYHHGHLGDG